MAQSEDEVSVISPKIKLFRLNRQSKMQANLQPLMQNNKKNFAQTLYYERHPEHQSPLMREEKGPVHERLGMRLLKRHVPLGTSTMSILPRRKKIGYAKKRELNTAQHFKKYKLHRVNSAQARLERIRAEHRNRSVIKLKRLNGVLPSVKNLTVQVDNSNCVNEPYGLGLAFNKFRMLLNSEIQLEIAEIQKGSVHMPTCIPPSTRITPIGTGISTSDRFRMLS